MKTLPLPFIFAGVIAMANASARAASTPVTGVNKQSDGILLTLQPGVLRLQVWADGVIRVTYAAGNELPRLKSYTVIGVPSTANWDMQETAQAVTLQTPLMKARVNKQTGAVGFYDSRDAPLLSESDNGREIAPAVQAGVKGTLCRQSFALPPDEGIYGLGQHQQGVWNYRGHTVRLLQENREVGIPVILSSKGYSLLWDNPAVTEVAAGVAAPATMPAPGRGVPPGAGTDVLRWSSEVGQAIDYYFCYGPTADESIRAYRKLSGDAPLMPRWLWGFFQCKERYRTQEEMLSIAKQYRDLKVPIDGIIQDWRYWPEGTDTWGSHQFDKTRYPDPAGMFKQLHDEHYHNLISVWPKFDVGSANSKELIAAGAMFDPVIKYVFPAGQGQWYDPFSEKGRTIYWNQISRSLFALGVDGWWLDAPEPELSGQWGEFRTFRTSVGPGAEVFNAYPLMHSTGIYQGQRAQTDAKRVVILTRSAYAGQQRNSAITWSGDIGSSWQVLRNQIPAGLNFVSSGIPYWNTDIGGFSGTMNPANAAYQEVFTRWFQFGSFCPMFRVHGSAPAGGTGPGKEFWRFDAKTQQTWRTFVNLRYRLLPYIYSVSWQVTAYGYTMMRPLVMDFGGDPQAADIGDQYMFGPALLVNPVTAPGATTRGVYLPSADPSAMGAGRAAQWYDFWTGKHEAAGRKLAAAAPLDSMPLFVRAGAIVPMGPLIQYVDEKPADPLEIRVYRGADGDFTLYEDEGDSYHYEKGVHTTIPFSWDDKAAVLTIGARQGEFPGMLKDRTFRVVFVAENHGTGVGDTEQPDRIVKYSGTPVAVR